MKRQVISELALLDRVQMTEADRVAAKAMAARAEAIADAVYHATRAVQGVTRSAGRGIQALAQRLRTRFA